jgi:tyrosine-protein phosphatase YwqE
MYFWKKNKVFSIFKKKPSLDVLIPQGFVDIHNHVLAGIDDGAKNPQETAQLLANMYKLGIAKCIATPHTLLGVWDNTQGSIKAAFQTYQAADQLAASTKVIRAASEYMIDNSLMERIQNEQLLTLKDNIVLLEMSYQAKPLGLFEIIFELQLQGYEIILAHPERYYFFHQNFKDYEKLKQSKVKFQLNLLSTTGYYGKDVATVADQLLAAQMIDYVGTDIHNMRHIHFFKHKVMIKSIAALENAISQNIIFNN